MGGERCGEGMAYDPKLSTSSLKHAGGSVVVWACMTAGGTGPLMFIDNVTADISSKINPGMCRAKISIQELLIFCD